MNTVLMIIGYVLLILLILIFIPLRFCVCYSEGSLKVVLKYFFFRKTLADIENEKVIVKKITDTGKNAGISSENAESKVGYFFEVVRSSGWAFKKLLKRIKIKDIVIDFIVSDEDACECAVKFGRMNILVYNAFAALGYFIRLKKKSINIRCVYNQPKCIYNASFKICVLPAAVIIIFIGFCWNLVKLILKHKKQEKMDEMLRSITNENTSVKKEENKDEKAA